MILILKLNMCESLCLEKAKKSHVFIRTLLSAAVFRQRFSFFIVCLVKYLHEVHQIVGTKGKIFEI